VPLNLMRNWIVAFGLSVTSQALSTNACDANSFALFLAKAQSLAADSEVLGRQLVSCPREDYRESTLYWLSFYLFRTNQSAKTDALMQSLPLPAAGEKATLRHKAWNGDVTGLKSKVQAGDPAFVEDPQMILALARTSMRTGAFKDGLLHFEVFLKQNESQEAIEAERLYAYIWSGDTDAARLQIAAMRRYELSPYLQQTLQRAEVLLGQTAPNFVWAQEGKAYWLHVATVQAQDNRGYARRGLEAAYRGLVDLDVTGFETRHPLNEARSNHASFLASKAFGRESLRILSGLGYWSSGPDFVQGVLRSEWHPMPSLRFGLGVRRQPVILVDKPTLGEREGLMRDSGEFMLGYKHWFVWQSSINREESSALFERHQLEFRYGNVFAEEWTDGYGFFLPIRYRHEPQPSQDRLTFPREIRVGFGLRLVISDGTLYRLSGEALLESIDRSSYPEPESFRKLLGTQVKIDARYFLSRSLYGQVAAEVNQTERDAFEKEEERETKVLVGIGLRETP